MMTFSTMRRNSKRETVSRIIFPLVCALMMAFGTAALAQHPETLPGTKPLEDTSDLAMDNLVLWY